MVCEPDSKSDLISGTRFESLVRESGASTRPWASRYLALDEMDNMGYSCCID